MNAHNNRWPSAFARVCMLLLGLVAQAAYAQTDCKNRGDLDALYCDENKDLVADTPTDAKRFKNPSTLVFTYTPVEDPAVYENIFKPFTEYLGKCTGKRVVFYQVQSNAAEIEAMRSGRLHVGGFSTGPTNLSGALLKISTIASTMGRSRRLTSSHKYVQLKLNSGNLS